MYHSPKNQRIYLVIFFPKNYQIYGTDKEHASSFMNIACMTYSLLCNFFSREYHYIYFLVKHIFLGLWVITWVVQNHWLIDSLTGWLLDWLTDCLMNYFTQSSFMFVIDHSFMYSFIHSFLHVVTYLFPLIYSPIYSSSYFHINHHHFPNLVAVEQCIIPGLISHKGKTCWPYSPEALTLLSFTKSNSVLTLLLVFQNLLTKC